MTGRQAYFFDKEMNMLGKQRRDDEPSENKDHLRQQIKQLYRFPWTAPVVYTEEGRRIGKAEFKRDLERRTEENDSWHDGNRTQI